MQLQYAQINPASATREEVQKEIERLSLLMNNFRNEEQAIKIFINSVYGASASPHFIGYNTRVAEAITLQGQEIIRFVSQIINRYFLEFWHKDADLHQKLGIETPRKITREVVIYGDTDSAYVTMEDVVDSVKWERDPQDLILEIYKHRLNDYLNKSFESFAKKCGTTNVQNLEMETISYSGIFLRKKKYVLDMKWKAPSMQYQPQSKIKATGVEMAQSSTPAFARTRIKEFVKIIFRDKQKLNMKDFVEMLKREKQAFMLENIENISFSSSIGDYEKGIANDKTKFEVHPHCPIHVRAAGYYNFNLNASKWKNKYQTIKSGDKVRYYYAKAGRNEENVFAYLPGDYPVELAPTVDYDAQFAKCIIDPINRFITAVKLPPISPELITKKALF